MINLSVIKGQEGEYIPQMRFVSNAEVSIKGLATLVMLMAGGQLAPILLETAKQDLSEKDYEHLVLIIETISKYLANKKSVGDSTKLEAAKKPAVQE